MRSEIRIREERPSDIPAIRDLNQRAFDGNEEATIVDALRSTGAASASLVAVKDDRVVGHILFSPVSIETPSVTAGAIGLAPLAVLPEFQGKGIGSLLVREGLEKLRRAGHAAVVLVGHPAYYPRFGFVPARQYGLRCEFDCSAEAFMALELHPGSLSGLDGGVVRYRREFSGNEPT